MPCINGQTLQSKELLDGSQEEMCEKCGHKQGSHQRKRCAPFHLVLLYMTAIIIVFALGVSIAFMPQRTQEPSPHPGLNASCSESWIWHRRRCYYISDAAKTWEFSKKNCSSYGASLTTIDAPWELDFLMRLKGPSDSWIGLHREDTEKPWKWTNGSLFNNWFNIRADGLCVYLEDGVSSTWCDTPRHWICRKS